MNYQILRKKKKYHITNHFNEIKKISIQLAKAKHKFPSDI